MECVAQSALENVKRRWLCAEAASLIAELERYAAGAPLSECGNLRQVMQSTSDAQAAIHALMNEMVEAVRENPLGQVPFRHQYQHGLGMLQLAARGNAALSLVLYEKCDHSLPKSACFTDSECHEIVLRGSGRAAILSVDQIGAQAVEIEQAEKQLSEGTRISLDMFGLAKQMRSVVRTLVILRLSRTSDNSKDSLEYRLCDGKLLHTASGNRADSRSEMYGALLGVMGRADAAPVLADIANSKQGGEQLRWQSLRNCLSIDTAIGFEALSDIASDGGDILHGPAEALRGQLLATYPQLKELEAPPCLA